MNHRSCLLSHHSGLNRGSLWVLLLWIHFIPEAHDLYILTEHMSWGYQTFSFWDLYAEMASSKHWVLQRRGL